MGKYLKKYRDPKKKRMPRGMKIFLIVLVAALIIGGVVYYMVSHAVETNEEYASACEAMNQKEYDTAIAAFLRLGDYKDSAKKLHDCCLAAYNEETYQNIISIHPGDVVKYGRYDQDANFDNGPEPVEWRVLEVDGTRALLISVYGLDSHYYQNDKSWITWEECELREWMNAEMYWTLFNEEEQAKVLLSTVSPDKNPEYKTNPGNPTEDHLFLLSIQEAKKYFASNQDRQCKPTAYANFSGVFDGTPNGMCWWWLRTPGAHESKAAVVYHTGSIINYGSEAMHPRYVVRPVFWMDLTA